MAFLDRPGLTELTLVGHGWGGPLGLYAVQQRPEKFERLVLSNTWAWPLNGDLASEAFSRAVGNPVGRALVTRFNLLVNYFIPMAHKRRTLNDNEMTHYREATPTPESRQPCAALPSELGGARQFFTELAANLGTLEKLPALIVWADSDPIFTDEYLRRWESILPNHSTTVLHGVGHFLQSDAPEEFSEAIVTWWAALAGHDGATQ